MGYVETSKGLMAKLNSYGPRPFHSRPAGLSSDSDEFEFGSDIALTPSYEKKISRSWIKSNDSRYNCEYTKTECLDVGVSNEEHQILQGFESLQNTDIYNHAQNHSSTLIEPSIVVTQNNGVEADSCDIPLLLDVSKCDFNDYLGNGGETNSNNGSYSSQSSNRHSPNSWRKFPRHQVGAVLPLEEFRMASVQGNLTIIKSLQNQGVSVDQILKSGWTALMYASSCGKDDLVFYLLQQGADPNLHKELFTSLMAACASSQESESDLLACVNHLLNYGAKPDACERHRMTPLMFACKEGRVTIVDVLLKAKIDVNKQDNKGWSALSWAATKGHGRAVRKLLLYSADPSKTNMHGQRPSDIALAAGYMEIAEILERAETRGENAVGDEDLKILERSRSTPNISRSFKPIPTLSNCNEMEMILNGLELANLIPLFQNHKITLECFLRLHENDFEKIGIEEMGTRKKLLKAIADIHKQEWKTSSLPNLTQFPYITLPDAVSLMANINKQIRFIHASIGYMRDQIQASPRILELGQEKYNVTSLSNSFSTSLKNISSLGEEVKFFKAHLDKVCDDVDYSTADLIVVRKDDGRRWQRSLLTSLIVATSFAAGLWFCRPKTFASIFSLVPYPQSSVFLDVLPDTCIH